MTEKELSGKKKLVKALEKYERSFEEKYPQEDMEVEFSRQYEVYMEKLLSGKIPKRRKYLNTAGKRIAACVAAFMIIFGASMTVKAFREPVVEFFTNIYEKIVEIFFDDDDIAKSPSKIETFYTLGYVPEGYEMESFEVNNGQTMAKTVFSNGEDEIDFHQLLLDGRTTLDNENTDYKYFYVDDIKVATIEKNDKKTFYLNSGEYLFGLIVDIDFPEETIFEIISSVMEKD